MSELNSSKVSPGVGGLVRGKKRKDRNLCYLIFTGSRGLENGIAERHMHTRGDSMVTFLQARKSFHLIHYFAQASE